MVVSGLDLIAMVPLVWGVNAGPRAGFRPAA